MIKNESSPYSMVESQQPPYWHHFNTCSGNCRIEKLRIYMTAYHGIRRAYDKGFHAIGLGHEKPQEEQIRKKQHAKLLVSKTLNSPTRSNRKISTAIMNNLYRNHPPKYYLYNFRPSEELSNLAWVNFIRLYRMLSWSIQCGMQTVVQWELERCGKTPYQNNIKRRLS